MKWEILAENDKFIIFRKFQACQLLRKNKNDRVLFELENYSAIDGIMFDVDNLKSIKDLFLSIKEIKNTNFDGSIVSIEI